MIWSHFIYFISATNLTTKLTGNSFRFFHIAIQGIEEEQHSRFFSMSNRALLNFWKPRWAKNVSYCRHLHILIRPAPDSLVSHPHKACGHSVMVRPTACHILDWQQRQWAVVGQWQDSTLIFHTGRSKPSVATTSAAGLKEIQTSI